MKLWIVGIISAVLLLLMISFLYEGVQGAINTDKRNKLPSLFLGILLLFSIIEMYVLAFRWLYLILLIILPILMFLSFLMYLITLIIQRRK